MKTLRLLSVCLALMALTSFPGKAGEPAWWTQQKVTCGLPASLAYEDWRAQGFPCNSASAPASGDPAVQLGTTLGTAVGNVIGAAIVDTIRGNNADEEARERAMAEAQRRAKAQDAEQAAEQASNDARKQEQSYERLKGELKLSDSDAPSGDLKLKSDDESASLPPPPRQLGKEPDPDAKNAPRTAAYLKGKKDASDCLSQNAGGYCVGLSPADTMTCANDYHGGYTRGERAATETLKRLFRLGEQDRLAKHAYNGLATGVEGTCGVHAVEAYNSGFYDKPFTAIGR